MIGEQELVNGIPLLFVVIALVEYAKKVGVSGKALTVASLLIGAVLGVLYQFAIGGLPVTFAGVFQAVIYGLVLGLIASGVYDAGKPKQS